MLAIHFATWIASLDYTSVAISTLLVSTTPIWTAAYDALVHRKPLPRAAMAAFATGAAGLAMIVSYDRTPAPHPGYEEFGDALALGGAVAIGAYLLLVRTARARLDTRTIVTQTYSWAALTLIVAAVATRQSPPPFSATAAWAGILAMALISQLLGHTAMNASLRWFSPSAVAFASLLEPVFAAALALAIFGEAIPPLGLLGGVIVLGSIGVVLWTDPKPELA